MRLTRRPLRTVWLVALSALVGLSMMPAHANQVADSSDNMELLSSVPLRWKADPSISVMGPTYMSEFAFRRDLMVAAVQGNHPPLRGTGDHFESGLATFRITSDGSARQVGLFRCHSVGELTVWGDLVVQGAIRSAEAGNGFPRDRCDRNGLRMIDVSDPRRPRTVAFLPIPCGIGDQALAPVGKRIYIYAPSTCDEQTETFTNGGLFGELSVFRIFPEEPARSRKVGIVDLLPMNGCSEIAVTLVRDLAVCTANIDQRFGLIDISDPAAPSLIDESVELVDRSLHAPAFTWSGSHLIVGSDPMFSTAGTDEVSFTIYNIEDVTNPVLAGTWTPEGTGPESLTDGSGVDQNVYSITPIPMRDGREVVAIAHANLGFWLVDVTDPAAPRSIGHYVPSPEDSTPNPAEPEETTGKSDFVTAYWYNGYLYIGDLGQLKVFRVKGFNRRTAHYFRGSFNPQTLRERFVLTG